jgi:hypothetical protein
VRIDVIALVASLLPPEDAGVPADVAALGVTPLPASDEVGIEFKAL